MKQTPEHDDLSPEDELRQLVGPKAGQWPRERALPDDVPPGYFENLGERAWSAAQADARPASGRLRRLYPWVGAAAAALLLAGLLLPWSASERDKATELAPLSAEEVERYIADGLDGLDVADLVAAQVLSSADFDYQDPSALEGEELDSYLEGLSATWQLDLQDQPL